MFEIKRGATPKGRFRNLVRAKWGDFGYLEEDKDFSELSEVWSMSTLPLLHTYTPYDPTIHRRVYLHADYVYHPNPMIEFILSAIGEVVDTLEYHWYRRG